MKNFDFELLSQLISVAHAIIKVIPDLKKLFPKRRRTNRRKTRRRGLEN